MVREYFFISPTHGLISEMDGWVGAFEVTSNYWSAGPDMIGLGSGWWEHLHEQWMCLGWRGGVGGLCQRVMFKKEQAKAVESSLRFGEAGKGRDRGEMSMGEVRIEVD